MPRVCIRQLSSGEFGLQIKGVTSFPLAIPSSKESARTTRNSKSPCVLQILKEHSAEQQGSLWAIKALISEARLLWLLLRGSVPHELHQCAGVARGRLDSRFPSSGPLPSPRAGRSWDAPSSGERNIRVCCWTLSSPEPGRESLSAYARRRGGLGGAQRPKPRFLPRAHSDCDLETIERKKKMAKSSFHAKRTHTLRHNLQEGMQTSCSLYRLEKHHQVIHR